MFLKTRGNTIHISKLEPRKKDEKYGLSTINTPSMDQQGMLMKCLSATMNMPRKESSWIFLEEWVYSPFFFFIILVGVIPS